jgi:hypothetical protein
MPDIMNVTVTSNADDNVVRDVNASGGSAMQTPPGKRAPRQRFFSMSLPGTPAPGFN